MLELLVRNKERLDLANSSQFRTDASLLACLDVCAAFDPVSFLQLIDGAVFGAAQLSRVPYLSARQQLLRLVHCPVNHPDVTK